MTIETAFEPTHTPQGDVNMGTIKNATGGDEPTHTPQGDVKFSQNNSKCRSELEPTHTPQGDKQTEGTFLHCIDAVSYTHLTLPTTERV